MSERTAQANERDATGPGASSDLDELRAELGASRAALAAAESRHRTAQQQEELLRDELQHRARNMLAIIRSIFSRTVAAGGTIEDIADHFRGRLDVLTRYQLAQALGATGSSDFETMIRDELQSFHSGDDPRIAIEGPEIRLGHDMAQQLALAIHELVTNSIKFGALSSSFQQASLGIAWRTAEDMLTIEWRESGIAILAPAPLRHGFGREFIEQGLSYQLGAVSHLALEPGELTWIIAVPLKSTIARASHTAKEGPS